MMEIEELKNENYRILTREELIEEIEKHNLEVKYYFRVADDEYIEEYPTLSDCITRKPMLISETIVYYDDYEDDSTRECKKMLDGLNSWDIIILRTLKDLIEPLGVEFPEKLMRLYSNIKGLYIIDYENKNFIEVDIKLLLEHMLAETPPRHGMESQFENISRKYYDSKL